MTAAGGDPRPTVVGRVPGAAARVFLLKPLVPATSLIVLLLGVGIGLRLHRLAEQFLLDDEFHALMAAARHPLGHLASHFLFAANSIPVNLYSRWLLDGWGWNEMVLRLPSAVAGIGLLVAVWQFARRRQSGAERALIVGLIAIAPLLVYYSRITRPYALLAWLSFVNTAAAHRMLTESHAAGRARVAVAVAYGLSGGLAVWSHQVAVFAVAANGLVLLGDVLWRRGPRRAAASRETAIGFVTLVLTAATLVGPAVINSAGGFSAAYRSSDSFSLQTLQGFLELALGTGRTIPLVVCGGALVWGAVRSWWHDRWWLTLLAVQAVVCFGALAIVRAPDLYASIVLARYALPIVPLLIVTAAMGWADAIDRLTGRIADRGLLSPAASVAVLLVTAAVVAWGPLPAMLGHGGNFMHHAAWQETYRHDSTRAFGNVHRPAMGLSVDTLSKFYTRVAATGADAAAGMIEYPFPLGHNWCVAAFAQQYHGRPVWGGYVGIPELVDPSLDFVRGLATPGTLAQAVARPVQFRFRRFVDLRDSAALRATQARYLVIHLHPECEPRGASACAGGTDYAETDAVWLKRLADSLEGQLGEPTHADEWLRVFDLRTLSGDLVIPTANATSLRNQAVRAVGLWEKRSLLEQAAFVSPDDPRVSLDLGILLLAEENYPRALAMFESALAKAVDGNEPDDLLATAHDGCGVACFHVGRLGDAEEHFKAALRRRPGDQVLEQRLGRVRQLRSGGTSGREPPPVP